MNHKRLMGLTLLLFIGVFIVASHFHTNPEKPAVPINTRGLPSLGDPHAKVRIVVFEDMKCVHCSRFNKGFYPKIKNQYIDTGRANYTAVILAFLPGSQPAGNAAYCAGQEGYFYPFVETVYKDQPDEMLDWATPTILEGFAKRVKGMNVEAFKSCLQSQKYYPRLRENYAIAQQVMGTSISTPRVYVNGIWIQPFSMSHLAKVIKEEEQK